VRDLKPILSRLEQAGRELFVVSDSCYSGQAVRGLYADRSSTSPLVPRYTPLAARSPSELDELESTPGLGAGRKPDPYPYSNVIYLAAASDSEPAMDIRASALALYPTLDGKPHGAVADALLRVLKGELPADFDRNGKLDYAEMSRAVQDFVAARGYGHTPRSCPGSPKIGTGWPREPCSAARRRRQGHWRRPSRSMRPCACIWRSRRTLSLNGCVPNAGYPW
jgi:hypothetical protein